MSGAAWRYREGFPAPKGVTAAECVAALAALPSPQPEHLVEAAKAPRHVLHDEFYGRDDRWWALRGRIERARQIIGAVEKVDVRGGGVVVSNRLVESVRDDSGRRFEYFANIVKDDRLVDSLVADAAHQLQAATRRLQRIREILRQREGK